MSGDAVLDVTAHRLRGLVAAGLVARTLGAAEPWGSYRPDGLDQFVGTSGYHTGETLRVLRRTDGSISHLECATFVFTRIPYDPQAPIPGR